MDEINISIAARTDKAGRPANQDSLWVCADLENVLTPNPEYVNRDKWIPLGSRGSLLVVADGMGGASSGEIASATVISNLRQSFNDLPTDILGNSTEMQQFMLQALIRADEAIKDYAQAHPESKGMGSTTVMVWLYGYMALCAWVGDSRIYRYGRNGLERLSHDHSYVQELVDAGAITQEQAFEHPNGNIITRAMGDTGKPVNPDAKCVELTPGDILLLCSDGLSGLLPDNAIQSVIAKHLPSGCPSDILKALWNEGEYTGWTDNATIVVAMTAGVNTNRQPHATPPSPLSAEVNTPPVSPSVSSTIQPSAANVTNTPSYKTNGKPALLPKWVWMIIGILVGILLILVLVNYLTASDKADSLQPNRLPVKEDVQTKIEEEVEEITLPPRDKNPESKPLKEGFGKTDEVPVDKTVNTQTKEEQAQKVIDAVGKKKENKPESSTSTPNGWTKNKKEIDNNSQN